jgi:hypothetical protein
MMSRNSRAPAQPRRLTQNEQDALNKVRRRVGATVFGVVSLHAIIALIGLSRHYDNIGRHGDATGLLIMSALLSVFQYVGVRLILGRSLVSGWIILGLLLPTLGFVLR